MTLQRKQQGFTIVELLIVIVVIGILALLVVTTFTGIQQRARNTERETDIKSLHSQLEAFYAQEGYYPDLANLNNDTWRTTNLRGIDTEAFRDPGASDAVGTTLAATNTGLDKQYAYVPAECDGAECQEYTLYAAPEGSTEQLERPSLNSVPPATTP